MVAKHERRIATVKEGGKKKTNPKADKPMKPVQAKQAKPAIAKKPKPKPLVDEPDEEQDQPEVVPEPQGACEEYDLEQAIQMSLESFQAQGQAHVGTRETPSPADAETCADTDKVISKGDTEILNIGEEQEEDVDNKVYLMEQTVELDEGHVGSDPGKTLESRPPPDDDDKMDEDQAGSDPGKSYVALAITNPKPMYDDFVATVYPKLHKSLKILADEQVILEDPPSSFGTLSSMKNLDDTYTFGDQFFNDKSTKDELRKQNVDTKVVSMVTVPIHQAYASVSPLSKPIIDLLPPKAAASPLPEPFTAAITETTTTTLPLPPPPQQQSMTDSELAACVTALEKKFADFEKKSQTLDNTNRDKFLAKKDMSRKRRLDDQDPPPHLPDLDLSKKKRHYSDASRSKQPPAPHSSAWKAFNTREAPSSSSKQQSTPYSKQPVEDMPIPDDENKLLSKTRDIGSFIKWFCKRIGKKKLSKSDLEGPAFKVIRAFHENIISLQFQMEECHRMLTDQVDLVNPEGHRLVPDVSKLLPLGDPPGQVTIQP
uniref:Uncharacterized protein n=1 Tax=Tanacetum cinerariifolium TaxID=118510 RepID=A0A6L2MR44_TANCI|nr:hypothetical protein [Tanacetum cinerariifolium]